MTEIIDHTNVVLFWVFLYILLWQAYYLFFNKGIPNITTAPAIRRAIIAKINNLNIENPVIYDLGCGNGKFSREIAKNIPNSHIFGVEIDQIAYFKAIFIQKFNYLTNISYINDDFYNIKLSNADIVFFFLVGRDMSFIREKLEQDLKPGAIVITNKFQMGGAWRSVEDCTVKTLAPAQKTFYIYANQNKHKQE